MTPQQIQQLIKQEVRNAIFNHYHNGVDSHVLKTPFTFFTGSVTNGNTGIPSLLPKGWSVATNQTAGTSTLTHNLGNTNYIFIPIPTQNWDVPVVLKSNNYVLVNWISAKLGTADTTLYDFLLIQPQAQQQLQESFPLIS